MFEILFSCNGLSEATGISAALDVADEFVERPWHSDVHCLRDGSSLILRARNDYDHDGQALADEFSDAVCACTPIEIEISIRVVSVREVPSSDA
ncbi:hypothetical protein Xmlh_06165 [Xanthomonas axonopodis pv. melhusii]|uniref:Uncharacterized protein n=1 Tax=Xanthomonas axonopodis pv. melhusii TaxID=487834 RepID=A0A1T1P9E1_9XANT|nr:hypothetical protein Xmlh_06165 [Xanthomonas axonopodis pv. melhusii]